MRAFGDALSASERKDLVRRTFRHGQRQLQEVTRLARADRAWVEARVQLDDSVARLDEVLAAGRGAIVVTAHLGNWELLAARLSHRGHGGAVVGRQHPRDPAAAWLPKVRAAHGVETLAQDAPPRKALEVLRRGEVLGLLCDLEVRRLDGEFVPFFGHPALTIAAPAALARAAGAPLLPVRCIVDSPSGYRLIVDEPLHLDPTLDKQAARVDLLSRMNQRFEAWIREHPEQWAWHQHRWRTAPGEREVVPLAERKRREAALRAERAADD